MFAGITSSFEAAIVVEALGTALRNGGGGNPKSLIFTHLQNPTKKNKKNSVFLKKTRLKDVFMKKKRDKILVL